MASRFSTYAYLAAMGSAAALSIARGMVVATVLPSAEFGHYVVVMGIGVVLSTLLSAGTIESTYKQFPRLVHDGLGSKAVTSADGVSTKLVQRALLACVAVAALAFSPWSEHVAQAAGAVAVAVGTAVLSLYASLQRATGRVIPLGWSTLTRALIALALAAAGASALGWHGAIAGEVIAALLGAALGRKMARQGMALTPADAQAEGAVDTVRNHGGAWLFAGFLLQAVPTYLDRLVVATAEGAAAAGRYGVLMLFVTGANAFAGILAQKVGPELVRMEHGGVALGQQMRHLGRWACVFFGAIAVAVIVMLALADSRWEPAIFAKYALGLPEVVAISALAALQLSVLVDFVLISRDGERRLLVSAGAFVSTAAVAALVMLAWQPGVLVFVWMLVVAKAVHLATQLALLTASRHRRTGMTEVQP